MSGNTWIVPKAAYDEMRAAMEPARDEREYRLAESEVLDLRKQCAVRAAGLESSRSLPLWRCQESKIAG